MESFDLLNVCTTKGIFLISNKAFWGNLVEFNLVGINPKTFLLRCASSSIKDSLKIKTNEAYEKGILEHQVLFQIIRFFGDKTE